MGAGHARRRGAQAKLCHRQRLADKAITSPKAAGRTVNVELFSVSCRARRTIASSTMLDEEDRDPVQGARRTPCPVDMTTGIRLCADSLYSADVPGTPGKVMLRAQSHDEFFSYHFNAKKRTNAERER